MVDLNSELLFKKNGLDGGLEDEMVVVVENGVVVNYFGYRDQLKRQYSFLGLVGIVVMVDNVWVVLGLFILVFICMFLL